MSILEIFVYAKGYSINDLNILKDLRKKAVKVNTIEDFYKILIQE